MKVSQERLEGSRVALTVEVDADRVNRETDRAYQHLGSRVAVPGFRRGKAPRHILRNYVGDQRLRQETLDRLLPDAYKQALEESGVTPIAEPEVELLAMEPDQPLSFKATVPVAPTVELGDYRGVRQQRQPAAVTDEKVDAVIEELRRQHATWEDVTDRGIEPGDRITADVRAEAEGETILERPHWEITVGQNSLPKEVDDALAGTQAGEERTVLATLPNDYPNPALAGKEAAYTIAVSAIKQPILPDVDDAFAQAASEGAQQDVPALRAELRQRLERSAAEQEEERLRRAVVEEAIARSTLDYPAVLVERHLDRSLNTFADNVARQGFKPEQYLQMLGLNPQEIRERWRPDAEQAVKQELLLGRIADAEGIEPSEEQLQQELARLVGDMPEEQRAALLAGNPRLRPAVRSSVRERLALDRLVQLATGEVPSPPAPLPEGQGEAPPEPATPPHVGDQLGETAPER